MATALSHPGSALAAALLALLAAVGSGAASADAAAANATWERPKRVFFVTLDTLRSDHLDLYGYPRETAPFLASIARRGAVFERMIAASSHTNPAHASLFTGLQLPQHRFLFNGQESFDPSVRTLTQAFQDSGFETGGFFSAPWLDAFGRGFDAFETGSQRAVGDGKPVYARGEDTMADALAWLAGRGPDEDFFLWVHLYDPHHPYQAPAALAQAMQADDDAEQRRLARHWSEVQRKDAATKPFGDVALDFEAWQSGYDAEIAYADAQLRQLYDAAEARGMLAGSLWIVTADHGEGMGSHGYPGHGEVLYQEQLLVPFIVHQPGGKLVTGNFPDLVQQIDLYPTLLEAIGSEPLQTRPLHGVSLLPLLRGQATSLPARTAYSQRRKKLEHSFTDTWEDGPVYAIQDDRYKYVVHTHGKDEFYDLELDPHELENLAGGDTPLEIEWRERARASYRELSAEGEGIAEPGLRDDHVEALRALGYIE